MSTSSPIRIDDDVHASAKIAAAAMSRSTAQQVAHWARIGRELERSKNVSLHDVALVLAGSQSYDDLGEKEQAIIRAEWHELATIRRENLDLEAVFKAEGRESYVELDDDGNVVTRNT